MAWKSFRVAVAPYGTAPIGLWGTTYQKVNMAQVERDDTGRWDTVNHRWTPVLVGEDPRPIIIHAQLLFDGGILMNGITCNCKIMRNATATDAGGLGHSEANEPVSGVFGSDQGMAAGQMTLMGVANPGDYFEVWTACTAWSAGNTPITFPGYGPGTLALDTHYAHSFMQGMVDVP